MLQQTRSSRQFHARLYRAVAKQRAHLLRIAGSGARDSRAYYEATFWRVLFSLGPFGAIASLSSERNAVNKSPALTMNRCAYMVELSSPPQTARYTII